MVQLLLIMDNFKISGNVDFLIFFLVIVFSFWEIIILGDECASVDYGSSIWYWLSSW